ncbi:cytochrome P450 [Roridomyces roridus]|uniref:Cytochrome P450 n=1 Tax=Roridomyces roridus TaxID=1738132 RepID=A0AAD7BC46_9AGAR|nr:cytochrome P450 [Roridomyces roridus]
MMFLTVSTLWVWPAVLVAACILPLVLHLYDPYGIRKYPGPFLAKFSYAWIFWVGISGRRSQIIHEAHDKYGAVIRISPREVSFSSPSVYSEIHSFSSKATKSNFYDTFGSIGVRNVFTSRSKADHVQRRKLLHPLFTAQVTREFTPRTVSLVEQLLNEWESRFVDGKYFDCVPWIVWLAFDSIGDFIFGTSLGMLNSRSDSVPFVRKSDEKTISLPGIISMREQYNYPVGLLPVWWRPLARRIVSKEIEAARTYHAFVAHRVEQRLSRNAGLQSEDVYDLVGRFLKKSKAQNEAFHPDALTSELNTILVAGTDTTRNSLIAAIYYLARSPDAQRTLQAELDSSPTQDISALPFLNACLNETLRLYSPVGIGLPRTVPHPGMLIAGEWFVGGTTVGVPIYTVHRDENIWGARTEEFEPRRWLSEDGRELRMDADALKTFSDGSMRCIGKHLALAQLRVMIAAIFKRFDVILENPEAPLHTEEWFVRKAIECKIGVRRRGV